MKTSVNLFHEKGYLIVDNAYSAEDLFYFKQAFWRIIELMLIKKDLKMDLSKSASLEEKCDAGLILLRQANPDYPLFVQGAISRSPEYFRLSSSTKVMQTMRKLLELEENDPLYLTNNGIIFTNPNDPENKRSSNIQVNWHKDTFFTIPRSRYVHIWSPVLHHADESIGTLRVCPGSHKEGIGKQKINVDAQYDHRYYIESKDALSYEPISINVKLGQALIFHQHLIHASGNNTSKNVRCTMIGMHHDGSTEAFSPLLVEYKYLEQTPEGYFYELFQDEKAAKIIHEQAAFPPPNK